MPDLGSTTAAPFCQGLSGGLDCGCRVCRLPWTRTATAMGLSALVIAACRGQSRPATDTYCVTRECLYAFTPDRRSRHG